MIDKPPMLKFFSRERCNDFSIDIEMEAATNRLANRRETREELEQSALVGIAANGDGQQRYQGDTVPSEQGRA